MNILTPLFLWLLPLIGIPFFIHLLNRRNIIQEEFSTLRFLKILEKESINKLNLLQLILLILRTIILLLIILMMIRPVFTGLKSLNFSNSTSLYTFILDDSFSMKGYKSIVSKKINELLRTLNDEHQVIWHNLNGGLLYEGFKKDLPNINNLVKFTNNKGNSIDVLSKYNNISKKYYTSNHIFFITDATEQSLDNIITDLDSFNDVQLTIITVPSLKNNLSIHNANVINNVIIPNNPIEIEVEVMNTGSRDIKDYLLQLIIDDMTFGQQYISIKSKETNKFYFKTILSDSKTYNVIIETAKDDNIEDNNFYLKIDVPKTREIAIISKHIESSFYLRNSLDAINISQKYLNITESTYLNELGYNLNLFDIIFIFGEEIFKSLKDSRLEEYIFNGGHLIFFPDNYDNFKDISLINTLIPDINISYNNINHITISDNSYQEFDLNNIEIKNIGNLFNKQNNEENNVKYFEYLDYPYEASISKISLKDGSTIWNRHRFSLGMLDVFGFKLNLNSTNLPIKGVFIPLIHNIVYSNNKNRELYKNVGDNLKINSTILSNTNLIHNKPNGERFIINNTSDNEILLESIGIHKIKNNEIDIFNIAVNISKEELQPRYLDIDKLNISSNNISFLDITNDIPEKLNQLFINIELWRYILYLISILLIVEMSLSNRKRTI